LGANYLDRLERIEVPTLIITPSFDKLIGKQVTKQMRAGIPHVVEVILPRTGHLFRFSHPETYAAVIEAFIQKSATIEAPRVLGRTSFDWSNSYRSKASWKTRNMRNAA